MSRRVREVDRFVARARDGSRFTIVRSVAYELVVTADDALRLGPPAREFRTIDGRTVVPIDPDEADPREFTIQEASSEIRVRR